MPIFWELALFPPKGAYALSGKEPAFRADFPPKGAYGFAVSPKGGVWEEGAISPRKMAA